MAHYKNRGYSVERQKRVILSRLIGFAVSVGLSCDTNAIHTIWNVYATVSAQR